MSIFYRKAAESAKEIFFLFAVDPPITLADRKDGKYKGKSILRHLEPECSHAKQDTSMNGETI